MLVYILCVRGIEDTQCGFKLMTRSAAVSLYHSLHINRWSVPPARSHRHSTITPPSVSLRAFDVELLYIAQQLGMPVREVAVNWQEIEGNYSGTSYIGPLRKAQPPNKGHPSGPLSHCIFNLEKRTTSQQRTKRLAPKVTSAERFHCTVVSRSRC